MNLKQLRFSAEPMTQYTHESRANVNRMRTLENSLLHHATLNCIMIHVAALIQTLKTNVTSMRCLNAL